MKVPIQAKYVNEMVDLQFGHYGINGSPSIKGISIEEGEPLFTATVALNDELPNEGCVFLKGWTENEGIPEALVKAGIVELTGRKIKTGFAEAVEAKLLQSD